MINIKIFQDFAISKMTFCLAALYIALVCYTVVYFKTESPSVKETVKIILAIVSLTILALLIMAVSL